MERTRTLYHRWLTTRIDTTTHQPGMRLVKLRRFTFWALFCSGVLCLTAGCSTVALQPQWPWSKTDTEPLSLPARILVIWSDTTLHQPGLPAIRGFGGRVFFYLKDRPEPIQVDGALTILAFGGEPGNSNHRPEKKFVFTVDQLPEHYAKCKLGHSYNIWIPWGVTDGPTRQIHLMARFEGRDGGIVFSEGVTKVLPGSKPPIHPTESKPLPEHDPHSVTPAGYQQIDAASRKTDMQVHAIDLPPHFARRLSPRKSPPDRAATTPITPMPSPTPDSAKITPAAPAPAVRPQAVDAPSTRSGSGKFPGKSGLRSPLTRAGVRRQPHPAAWQSSLPPTPRTGFRSPRETAESNALPIPRPVLPQSVE